MSISIEIQIDQENDTFHLSGDIKLLTSNRRSFMYLKDFLHASVQRDFICVPYEQDNQELVLENIRIFLSRFGAIPKFSPLVMKLQNDYFIEEKNFLDFSEKAKRIRNNNIGENEIADFKKFTDTLNNSLPNRKLYPLQLLSAFHLAYSQNACNFSVPGSGKTSIVLGAYSFLNTLEPSDPKYIDRILIIGPLSSFSPWETEFNDCFGHPPNAKRIFGGLDSHERSTYFYRSNRTEMTLISYNSVLSLENDINYFLKNNRVMVVLDEAHKIKNTSGGVMASAVMRLSRYCSSRVVLTGTPASNGYEDLFNLFKFIWPTKSVIPFHIFQLRELTESENETQIESLVHCISPYFMRIRKSDLDLPKPIENSPIIVPMNKVQQEIYDFIEKNYLEYFESSIRTDDLRSKLVKSRLIRLMQVSTNPNLLSKPITELSDGEVIEEVFIDDLEILSKILNYKKIEIPSKFIAAKDLIKKLLDKGEKVVVWAIFIQNLLEFQDYLSQNGIASECIYGMTPIEQDDTDPSLRTREKIIREFHEADGGFRVLIANPFAVSESISLHTACHNAIYLERSFNATHYIQSKDRIHRYGLKATDQINYYYFLSENNTDFTIDQRLKEKERRMLRIIEREAIPLFSRIDQDEQDDIKTLIANYVKHSSRI